MWAAWRHCAATGARSGAPPTSPCPNPSRACTAATACSCWAALAGHRCARHTSGHIAFFSPGPGQPLLFCGDTLFSGGCGRLFEGTAAQMQASLDALAALPANTRCAAHMSTLSNLRFARPWNQTIRNWLSIWNIASNCAQGSPRCPPHWQTELAINPFMRSRAAQVSQPLHNRASPGPRTRQRLAPRCANGKTFSNEFEAILLLCSACG
jgi:hypothetical protein